MSSAHCSLGKHLLTYIYLTLQNYIYWIYLPLKLAPSELLDLTLNTNFDWFSKLYLLAIGSLICFFFDLSSMVSRGTSIVIHLTSNKLSNLFRYQWANRNLKFPKLFSQKSNHKNAAREILSSRTNFQNNCRKNVQI